MTVSWVCPDCGLDYETVSPSDASVAVRSFPRRYGALVRGFDDDEHADALVRRRPAEGVWSALEYTRHVADVFEDMENVLRRMVVEDHPSIPDSWDPDQRAVDAHYNEGPVDAALGLLAAAAERLATRIEGIGGDDWLRTARFSYGQREVIDITRNAVHEGTHHLRDVRRGLTTVRGRPPRDDD